MDTSVASENDPAQPGSEAPAREVQQEAAARGRSGEGAQSALAALKKRLLAQGLIDDPPQPQPGNS